MDIGSICFRRAIVLIAERFELALLFTEFSDSGPRFVFTELLSDGLLPLDLPNTPFVGTLPLSQFVSFGVGGVFLWPPSIARKIYAMAMPAIRVE